LDNGRAYDRIAKPRVRQQTEAEEIILQPIGRGFQPLEQQHDVLTPSNGSLLRNGYRGRYSVSVACQKNLVIDYLVN